MRRFIAALPFFGFFDDFRRFPAFFFAAFFFLRRFFPPPPPPVALFAIPQAAFDAGVMLA
jgi:hypothetical protein